MTTNRERARGQPTGDQPQVGKAAHRADVDPPGVELAQAFLPRDLVDELDRHAEAIPDTTGHGRLAGLESEHPEG